MNIGQQPRVYPAVYSGVGVYECMIRGIAVMRRRADSYVNATQILKVAGIDKGRRTKILEKEILPGKHEIVQGGYGKYQGTWIPLERGRDVAAQYGVAPLLAPLFDHVPNNTMMGALPHQLGHPMRIPGNMPPMPFPNMRPPPYMIHYMPPNMLHGRPPMFAPGGPMYPPYQQMPPGPPGSQPRMQMYAPQPLPPGAHQMHQQAMMNHFLNANANANSPAPSSSGSAQPSTSTHPEPHASLKRIREEEEPEPTLSQDTDITMVNGPDDDVFLHPVVIEGPPPPKKARTDGGPTNGLLMELEVNGSARSPSPVTTIDPKRLLTAFPPTTALPVSLEPSDDEMIPRPSTMPTVNRLETRDAVRRSTNRSALYVALQTDEPEVVVRLILEQTDEPMLAASDINAIIDDKGHTALHVAAALGKLAVVDALISRGADVHRGNYRGETPLMRAVLTRENHAMATFPELLRLLRQSIRTTDESKKTVLHHISHVGALDRAQEANYYTLMILTWIHKHQGGNFDSFINLKDVNGDTALNIASRLGMNVVVEALISAGANPSSINKFGMTPLDYGVISGPKETLSDDAFNDLLMNIAPLQSRTSDGVLQDMMNLISSMAHDINTEKAAKDAESAELRSKIREVSKQLATNREEMSRLRPQAEEYDRVELRAINIEEQKTLPGPIDWTGRSQQVMDNDLSPAFWRRKQPLTPPEPEPSLNKAIEVALDPSPGSNSQESLVTLRRMKMWHERIQAQLKQQATLVAVNSERELLLRKLIAKYTERSELDVEENALNLLESAQAETQPLEQRRLAVYMDRVNLRSAPITS